MSEEYDDSPRGQRALQRAARRAQVHAQTSRQSPSPQSFQQVVPPAPPPPFPTRQPLSSFDQPSQPLPLILPQPHFGPALPGIPASRLPSAGAEEDFFASSEVAADQETSRPNEDESFFDDSLSQYPTDVEDFEDLEPFDLSVDGDIFSHVPELSVPTLNADGSSGPPPVAVASTLAPSPASPAPGPLPPAPSPPVASPTTPVAPTTTSFVPPPRQTATATTSLVPPPRQKATAVTVAAAAPPPPPSHAPPSPELDPDAAFELPQHPGFRNGQADRPADDEHIGAQCWAGLDGDTEDEDTYDSPLRQPPGRKSKVEVELLDEFTDKMNGLVHEYAGKTGRTASNVVSHWGSEQGYSRVHRSTWNKYQMHYKANRKEERLRTGNPEASCNECFEAFKLHYGKEWKKVLNVLDKIETEKHTNQHGYRRSREFNKYSKAVSRTTAQGHLVGFETVTLAVGSKLHHDQGLGKIVESEGARGFLDKLPINGDTLVGLLQDYSFGSVSKQVQDTLAHTFQKTHPELVNREYTFATEPDDNQPKPQGSTSRPAQKAMPVRPQASTSNANAQQPPTRARSGSVASVSSAATSQSRMEGKDDDDEKQKIDIIKAYFAQECERLGHAGASSSMLPWAKLKNFIAGKNLTIAGWPEGVRFPVPYDRTVALPEEEQRKIWNKKVGIRGIGIGQLRVLAAACGARTLRFERHQGEKYLLVNSHTPWIVGVRPADRALGHRTLLFNKVSGRFKAPGARKSPKTPPIPSSSSTPAPSVSLSTTHATPKFDAIEADASTPKASIPPPSDVFASMGSTSTKSKGPSRPISSWPIPPAQSFTHLECVPKPFPKKTGAKGKGNQQASPAQSFTHPECVPKPFPKKTGAKAKGKGNQRASPAEPHPSDAAPAPLQTPVVHSSGPTVAPAPPQPPVVQPIVTPAPPQPPVVPPPGPIVAPPPPQQPAPHPTVSVVNIPASVPPTLPTITENIHPGSEGVASAKRANDDNAETSGTKRPRGTTPAPSYTPYPMPMMPTMPHMPGVMPHQMGGMHAMYGMPGMAGQAPMFANPAASGASGMPGMAGQVPMFANTAASGASSPPPSLPDGHFQMPYGFYPGYGYYPPMQQYSTSNLANQQGADHQSQSGNA